MDYLANYHYLYNKQGKQTNKQTTKQKHKTSKQARQTNKHLIFCILNIGIILYEFALQVPLSHVLKKGCEQASRVQDDAGVYF